MKAARDPLNRGRTQTPLPVVARRNMKHDLGLSEQQSRDIEQIFRKTIDRQRERLKTLNQLEEDLSRLIEDGQASRATVEAQVDQVETTRFEMNKARTLMLYEVQQVLTPEQRATFRTLVPSQGRVRPS